MTRFSHEEEKKHATDSTPPYVPSLDLPTRFSIPATPIEEASSPRKKPRQKNWYVHKASESEGFIYNQKQQLAGTIVNLSKRQIQNYTRGSNNDGQSMRKSPDTAVSRNNKQIVNS